MATPQFPKGTKMAATKICKVQILVTVAYPGYGAPYCVRDKGRALCDLYNLLLPLLIGKTPNHERDCAVIRILTHYPYHYILRPTKALL
jgi:hypothetical protein